MLRGAFRDPPHRDHPRVGSIGEAGADLHGYFAHAGNLPHVRLDLPSTCMNGQDLLPPRLLQAAGLLLLFASFAWWMFSGHESALLVGAALSLIGLGSYSQAAQSLRRRNGNGNGKQTEDDQ